MVDKHYTSSVGTAVEPEVGYSPDGLRSHLVQSKLSVSNQDC